jgi:hypothetical protein
MEGCCQSAFGAIATLTVAVVVVASILCTAEDLGQASVTHQYKPETLASMKVALIVFDFRCSGYMHVGFELWST